jgi:hypothetical protein
MRRSSGGPNLLQVLLVFAAILAAFEDFLSADRIPAYRDLLVFVVPFKHFLADHLRRLQIPLWNPCLYMGTPFLASLQSGVLYPPSLVLALPFPLGFNLFLLLHFVAAAAGFWFFSRWRGLSASAAALGSLTFALGGYLVSMVSLTNHLQGAVWVPWISLFWMRYACERRRRELVLFVFSFVFELLAGSPETALMISALLVAWTMLAAPAAWIERLRLTAIFVGGALSAGGLAAFQLIPTLEYVQHSDRGGTLHFEEVTTWSLQPVSLLQLLLPQYVAPGGEAPWVQRNLEGAAPWISSLYLGIAPLCLAIAAVASAREARFWGAVIAVSMLLALGAAGPLLPWLYRLAPFVFGRFRYPEKFYLLVHFAAAVLASDGAERCLRHIRTCERLTVIAALALFAPIAGLLLFRWLTPASYLYFVEAMTGKVVPLTQVVPIAESLSDKCLRSVLLLACLLGMLGIRHVALLSEPLFRTILVLLVGVDLASVAHGLNHTVSWSGLQSEAPIVDVEALRARHQRIYLYQTETAPFAGQAAQPIPGLEHWVRFEPDVRSVDGYLRELWRTMLLDIPMVHGLGTLSGGDGIVRSSDNRLRGEVRASREGAVKLLRIFGVGMLAGAVPLEAKELEGGVTQTGGSTVYVYRMREPVAAAYLATRLSQAATAEESFRQMLEPTFEPGVDATVDALPPDWLEPAPRDGNTGEVKIQFWREEEIELVVRAERPLLLVLNDSFFPGWLARVDGVGAEIRRANYLSRAVFVPRGEHQVRFLYRPRSFYLGIAISLTSLLAATAAVLAFPTPMQTVATRPPGSGA